ncbi:MAG: nitroreductase family protein [Burkholderiales bacterium]|nr:nitroreductase family protein [Burkholderiales bacterium]
MHDTDAIEAVMRYHERTKHQFNRYAPGPGELDWANQPSPFRRYAGAPLIRLPLLGADEEPLSPGYDDLYRHGSVPSAVVTIRSLSRLLQYSLAISAWKQAGATRWALRCNPSSGNLHPTEGYLLIDALPGLGDAPGLYHYAPREHGLERRAVCSVPVLTALMRGFPARAFLFGLSSIHWREAWKYGERAFRYCQHDAGHAIGALRIAAATLGWSARLLHGLADETIEDLLGLNRAEDFAGAEREHPQAVMVVWPTDLTRDGQARCPIPRDLDPALAHSQCTGSSRLSRFAAPCQHARVPWSSTKSPSQRANTPATCRGQTRSKRRCSRAPPGTGSAQAAPRGGQAKWRSHICSRGTHAQAATTLWPGRSFCSGEACWPATAGRRSRPNASTGCSRG